MDDPREIRLSGQWVADAIGGTITAGSAAREFAGVSIDTRTLGAGELFVAIRGDRFDGAEFAPAAAAAGAAGIVVERGRGRQLAAGPRGDDIVVIEVDDAVVALQQLARRVRRQSGTKVVAITGSAGKTTTKEVTAEFLAARYRVIRNRGNFNNHIGLPLSLIELRQRPEIAVVELGMNHAGEISTLVDIAEPDVRVWTNVGEAHLGFFESVDAIADAKAEILEGADASNLLVANADDARIAARIPAFRGRVVTVGVDRTAEVRATDVRDRGIEGIEAQVLTPQGSIRPDDSARRARQPCERAGRDGSGSRVRRAARHDRRDRRQPDAGGASGRNPATVEGCHGHRRQLQRQPDRDDDRARRARPAVPVDRGAWRCSAKCSNSVTPAPRLHEDVGRAAAAARVDALVAVGGEMARALADAAVAAGLPRAAVTYVTTSGDAAALVATIVRDGDLVLVKGSRGVRTDLVVERLRAEFA